ncbi:hypothetical protein H310_10772 [Aphanomyces invadans]|uniref:Uncharacterized protein n=1 Tax=Aphanomyces invadans TaxID=157072 RepID=A0A024TPR4_9STRA|nr:hypothetical protein H310_10772 [Aphanomyces invadans]ETV96140.1 hypothetical protein H310_10772 [Aphanomyces invadans]|eukprot:XP_008875451.1 hypothetical protein H310_10772 [Aphanomyces invadans]
MQRMRRSLVAMLASIAHGARMLSTETNGSTAFIWAPSSPMPSAAPPLQPTKADASPVPWAAIVVGIVPALLLCAVLAMLYRRHTHVALQRSSTPSIGDQARSSVKVPAPSPSWEGSSGMPIYERNHGVPSSDHLPCPTMALPSSANAPLRRLSSSSLRASMEHNGGAVQHPRRLSNPSSSSLTQQARQVSSDASMAHPPQASAEVRMQKAGLRNCSTASMSFETHASSAADHIEPNPPFLSQFVIHPATTPWQPTQARHLDTCTHGSDMSDTFMYATGSSTTAEYGYEASVHAASAPIIGQTIPTQLPCEDMTPGMQMSGSR